MQTDEVHFCPFLFLIHQAAKEWFLKPIKIYNAMFVFIHVATASILPHACEHQKHILARVRSGAEAKGGLLQKRRRLMSDKLENKNMI
jgi:hypothetical protein